MVTIKKSDDSDCYKIVYKKNNRDIYTSTCPRNLSTPKPYLSKPTVAIQ